MTDAADDKYATITRNVDLPILAVDFGTLPLQDKPEHFPIRLPNGLHNWVSMLIPQVGVRTLETEVDEVLVERAKPLRNNAGPHEFALVTQFNDAF